ncbi:MAG: ribonuclease P protein component [Rickettsiales bacterium]|jgi:ribonuclease P protein component|nr:ribonuclease P protein component [Rickettsiales bacterium]
MLRLIRIKKRRDFVALQENVEFKASGRHVLILTKRTDDSYINKNPHVDISRNGVVATKKISKKAVVRNKIKRILRELIRSNADPFVRNVDYEVITKKTLLQNRFNILQSEFRELLEKIRKYYAK